jgi:hypothetical protein
MSVEDFVLEPEHAVNLVPIFRFVLQVVYEEGEMLFFGDALIE